MLPVPGPSGARCWSELMKNDAYKPSEINWLLALNDPRGPVNSLVRRIRPRIPWCNSRGIDPLPVFAHHVGHTCTCASTYVCETGRRSVAVFRSAGNVSQVNCGRQAPQLGPIHAVPPRAIFLSPAPPFWTLNRVDLAFSRSFPFVFVFVFGSFRPINVPATRYP